MPEPCPVCQAFDDTICLGGKRHAERDVVELACGYCGADCSAGFARVQMVEVKRNPKTGNLMESALAGERVRCDPPCEIALEESSDPPNMPW